MDYFLGNSGTNSRALQIHIYDQQLQLIYSEKFQPGHQQKLKHKLNQCSLLFNIDNTGYFIKKG